MRFGARIGVFCALGVTACTLLYGPSDAEFSSGTRDAGAPAPSVSTSASSSSGEGGTGPADAGSAFTCPTAALLCDDFENPASNPFSSNASTTQVVSGGEGGSGHALAAMLQQGQDVPQVIANFSPATAAATLEFWFKLDSGAPVSGEKFRLAGVLWGNGCDWQLSSTVTLTVGGLYPDLSTYDQHTNGSCGPVNNTQRNPPLAASAINDGNWHHVTLASDARTQHLSITMTVDAQAPVTLALDMDRTDAPTTVGIAIGVPCVQTTGGCFDYKGPDWRVLFDNVTLVSP